MSVAISEGESDQLKTCERALRPAAHASPASHLLAPMPKSAVGRTDTW